MSVIDDYLKLVDEPQKAALEHVRSVIKDACPEATDVISYAMPGFKYKGKYLITFAPFKDHMSIFPGSNPVEDLQEELKDFKQSKGTIQFTHEHPLPDSLIQRLVKARVRDIDQTT